MTHLRSHRHTGWYMHKLVQEFHGPQSPSCDFSIQICWSWTKSQRSAACKGLTGEHVDVASLEPSIVWCPTAGRVSVCSGSCEARHAPPTWHRLLCTRVPVNEAELSILPACVSKLQKEVWLLFDEQIYSASTRIYSVWWFYSFQ
jgi:hypothetical protein